MSETILNPTALILWDERW